MRISGLTRIICVTVIILVVATSTITSIAAMPDCTSGEHSFRIETVRKATESSSGLERHTCSKCGYSYEESTPKTGHSYGSWQTDIAPSCGSQGRLYRTCTNCGKKDYKIVGSTKTHSLGKWETSSTATCTTDGKKQRHCSNCSYYETHTTKSGGHSYTINKKTTDEWVFTSYDCSVCGHKYTEKIAAGANPDAKEEPVLVEEELPEEEKEDKKEDEKDKEKNIPVRIIEEIIPKNVSVDVRANELNEVDGVLAVGNIGALLLYGLFIGRNLFVIKWDRVRKAKLKERKI